MEREEDGGEGRKEGEGEGRARRLRVGEQRHARRHGTNNIKEVKVERESDGIRGSPLERVVFTECM